MPPRWIKTADRRGSFPPVHPDDDLLLVSGAFVVGRVLPAMAGRSIPTRWGWSLTGPYSPGEAGAPTHGYATSLEEAKAALLASWRRWQQWAGVRDA